jgi:hypothetical protein
MALCWLPCKPLADPTPSPGRTRWLHAGSRAGGADWQAAEAVSMRARGEMGRTYLTPATAGF